MDETDAFLLFELSGRFFAIFVPNIRAVQPMRELISTPELPPFVEGLLEDEGASAETPFLPVLRLDRLLRLSPPARVPGLHTPLVLVRSTAEEKTAAFALLVERVLEIVRLDPNSEDTRLSPAHPQETLNGCVEAILALPDGRSAAVLSVSRLLLAQESERLAYFSQREKERREAVQLVQDVAE